MVPWYLNALFQCRGCCYCEPELGAFALFGVRGVNSCGGNFHHEFGPMRPICLNWAGAAQAQARRIDIDTDIDRYGIDIQGMFILHLDLDY
jgi:hypothetical protein